MVEEQSLALSDFKIKRNRSQWIDGTIVVDSMHERKTKMNDLCDVITLPGALELLKSFLKCLGSTWTSQNQSQF
jgi:hypothetical protein